MGLMRQNHLDAFWDIRGRADLDRASSAIKNLYAINQQIVSLVLLGALRLLSAVFLFAKDFLQEIGNKRPSMSLIHCQSFSVVTLSRSINPCNPSVVTSFGLPHRTSARSAHNNASRNLIVKGYVAAGGAAGVILT